MPYEHPDIKIFVSRRIDVDSVAVDNPLYIPVRCGAVFDTRGDSPFQGDNTGENISQKRLSFCELTVQYWAWKNLAADYYGLCHYRRYLSFAARDYRADDHGLVPRCLTPKWSVLACWMGRRWRRKSLSMTWWSRGPRR